ncbi:MAG: NAD(P)-binding protein, partial [Bacteroidales bacterium]|nr:NAD(P)-binding protein [Bacteroidales bacterium]
MLTLRNKFIFAPIKLGYSDASGIVKQKHIDFYVRRSKYIAAVTPEPFFLDECLKEVPTQMGIHDDKMIEGLKRLNLAIHNEGAKTIAHLNHPGRMANPKIPGNYFWSSTNKACENGGAVPEKMDRKKINTVIRLFVNAARRAVASNFDMIELQFGHGYLLAQFLSPAVNDRKDDYGGSFENRIRFPLELARAVRREVDVPIIARIIGDEMIEKGFHLDEMIRFSLMLQNTGLDGIHVSAGSVCSTPPWFFQHMFIPKGKTWEMAEAIKKHLNIPVIFVGRINSPEDVHELDKKYHADYLAVGRALVADPDFIGKYLGKLEGNIRPCLACADGCLGGVKSGVGLQCLVNPDVGKDHVDIEKVKEPQKYAVVGGGLAGMEAALILKKRGHEVDLYEKEKLGGQFNLAPLTPGKKSMGVLVPYFVKELEDNKVHVIYKEARD